VKNVKNDIQAQILPFKKLIFDDLKLVMLCRSGSVLDCFRLK
jgi:hypothetical protein